ncbi:MAG: SGNH/GDSL hydrolase family protein [Clostridia bacterium]|nr:SGNH/GDSL hydrolase family protein [Clostridia bacterium]
MINILCFGDSNTFGTNPKGGRHSWNTRWPGRLQVLLGPEYYVIEEGMGGRTTVWDDPLEPGRCGIQALPMALQSHKPLDLVILFLGTNDCKAHFHASPRVITKGMENLCRTVQRFDYGEGYKKPQILVISPIHIGKDMEHCPYASFDETAPGKSMALAPLYQELAKAEGCLFLDAASLAGPSSLDQLHMDAKNHGALAEGIAEAVKGYFEP